MSGVARTSRCTHDKAASAQATGGALDGVATRRRVVVAGSLMGLANALVCAPSLGATLAPSAASHSDDVVAPASSLAAAIDAFTQGAPLQTGRITLDVAPLIDNGNVVPVTVQVESPMTAADHVQAIALFADRNPQPEVVRFHLTPRSGLAQVSTRIRLATSQAVVAIARMSDGSVWVHRQAVVVTLAACIEGDS
jgi:sulfur-oxidizing protein SoxY